MATIPPVSVRQVRPCCMCHFDLAPGCQIDLDVSVDGFDFRSDCCDNWPCDKNITTVEILELIDEHNAK